MANNRTWNSNNFQTILGLIKIEDYWNENNFWIENTYILSPPHTLFTCSSLAYGLFSGS